MGASGDGGGDTSGQDSGGGGSGDGGGDYGGGGGDSGGGGGGDPFYAGSSDYSGGGDSGGGNNYSGDNTSGDSGGGNNAAASQDFSGGGGSDPTAGQDASTPSDFTGQTSGSGSPTDTGGGGGGGGADISGGGGGGGGADTSGLGGGVGADTSGGLGGGGAGGAGAGDTSGGAGGADAGAGWAPSAQSAWDTGQTSAGLGGGTPTMGADTLGMMAAGTGAIGADTQAGATTGAAPTNAAALGAGFGGGAAGGGDALSGAGDIFSVASGDILGQGQNQAQPAATFDQRFPSTDSIPGASFDQRFNIWDGPGPTDTLDTAGQPPGFMAMSIPSPEQLSNPIPNASANDPSSIENIPNASELSPGLPESPQPSPAQFSPGSATVNYSGAPNVTDVGQDFGVFDPNGNLIQQTPQGLHSGFPAGYLGGAGIGPAFATPASGDIAQLRQSAYSDALSDPTTAQHFANSIKAEVGFSDPAQSQGYVDQLLNRGIARDQSLDTASTGSYYPAATRNQLNDPVSGANMEAATNYFQQSMQGTNTSNVPGVSPTGNASNDPNVPGGMLLSRAGSRGETITSNFNRNADPSGIGKEGFVLENNPQDKAFSGAANSGLAFGAGAPDMSAAAASAPGTLDTATNVPGLTGEGVGTSDLGNPATPLTDAGLSAGSGDPLALPDMAELPSVPMPPTAPGYYGGLNVDAPATYGATYPVSPSTPSSPVQNASPTTSSPGTFMPADFTGLTSGTGTPAAAENQANLDAANAQLDAQEQQQQQQQQAENWILQNRLQQAPESPEVGPTIQQQVETGQRLAASGLTNVNPDPAANLGANPQTSPLASSFASGPLTMGFNDPLANPTVGAPAPAAPLVAANEPSAPTAPQSTSPTAPAPAQQSAGGVTTSAPQNAPAAQNVAQNAPSGAGGTVASSGGGSAGAARAPVQQPIPAQAPVAAASPAAQPAAATGSALSQLPLAQQQQIASYQSDLVNQWRQVFLTQGIPYPEQSPSWPQVQALIQNQVNAQIAQAAQANTGQAKAA